MAKNTPENYEKRAIKEYLALNGWFYYHNLAGLGVYPGVPDITAIKRGFVLQIEVKARHGKQSPNQREFENNWTEAGGAYFCGNFDDLIRYLKDNGKT